MPLTARFTRRPTRPLPVRPPARAMLLIAAGAGLAACTSHPLVAVDPRPEVQTDRSFTVEPETKLDLLFLVDNSQSMKEEQSSLAHNFPLLMQALEAVGPLDLRLAVISSDVGAGGSAPGSPCRGFGDGGKFKAAAGCGLDPGATFLSVDRTGRKNFSGELGEVFACIADLGTEGCGFEHQLQALRFALFSRPQADEFLRADAHLGIVLITDEDDCSGEPEATLYADPRPGQDPNLRCATAGHMCGDRPVPASPFTAPLASCRAFEHSGDAVSRRERLINVSEVAAQIKGLKGGGPRQVIVSAVMGWDAGPEASYRVAAGSNGLMVSPICSAPGGVWATPAVRLKQFVDAFEQSSWHSICEPDLRQAIAAIGKRIGEGIGPDGVCLPAPPRDGDLQQAGLQADCVVVSRPLQPAAAPAAEEQIPACSSGRQPCWEILERDSCPSGRFLAVRGGSRAEGQVRKVSCATCAAPDDPTCAY